MKKTVFLLMLCSLFLMGCTMGNYANKNDEKNDGQGVLINDFEQTICNVIEELEQATFCVIGSFEEDGINYTTSGSGVIYKKDRCDNGVFLYYMLTNKHVVEHGSEFKIYDGNGSTINSDVLGMSSEYDLAVLTFTSINEYESVSIGVAEDVVKGQYVVAMGTPLSTKYYNTATVGNVSGIRSLYIQHSAMINSGNSGGPLVNLNGELIGINTMKITETNSGVGVEGMYFAIRCDHITKAIKEIEENNSVKPRPVIGVTVTDVSNIRSYNFETFDLYREDFITKCTPAYIANNGGTEEEAKKDLAEIFDSEKEEYLDTYNKLKPLNAYIYSGIENGVFVTTVAENGPAYLAKIKKNDIIVKFNGVSLNSVSDFLDEISKHIMGEKLSIEINRNGQTLSLQITI